MHMGRRCPAQQRRVRVYLLLQEPAKFQPSLIRTPAPACASALGAGSDPQSGRPSVPSSISTAGPSPEALHPTPTHRPQPVRPPRLLHGRPGSSTCLGQDPLTFGSGASEPVLPHGGRQLVTLGDLPRPPPPRQTPTGVLLKGETQRAGLPAEITASARKQPAHRLEGPSAVAILAESLPDSPSEVSITASSVPVVATE